MRVALLALFPVALAAQPVFVTIPAGASGEPSFQMTRTEISVGDFERFVKATGYQTAAEKDNAPRTWRVTGFPVETRQPVVYVTPDDAQAYCAWAGARLPTEAEWERAARAGSTTRHYWGDTIDGRYLWYRENSDGRPQAVGTKRPNAWGLYDMEGNVWEWALVGNKEGDPLASRRGASWVSCENIIGGPGRSPSQLIGTAIRFAIPIKFQHRYDDIGFRCAR